MFTNDKSNSEPGAVFHCNLKTCDPSISKKIYVPFHFLREEL